MGVCVFEKQLGGQEASRSRKVLRKAAGKAMAIDFCLPGKEAGGRYQYGLNTPDGVNMVDLMVHDTLRQNAGHSTTTVDGRNAFNSASRQ